jgi:hypothetical protein
LPGKASVNSQDFAEQVAAWLRHSISAYEDRGDEPMNLLRLSKASKVSRATLYRIVDGKAGEIDEGTLGKIADALGVARPGIARSLLVQGSRVAYAEGRGTNQGQLLREAQHLLRRAGKMAAPGAAISRPSLGAEAGEPEALLAAPVKKGGAARKRSHRNRASGE